ncbi:MAG: MMPL family transporter [Gammaproteobacteria bacterium]|nr:MMPL family transporter [Gammaproteobacteria bacterium]MCP4982371.1 MMPL family transporter [Gammaproteobacteria bacterium]
MLTDYFIKRPVLSLVISTMIVLLGVQAFFNTQVRQYPELETSVISITTAYPGASAELIQGFISTPVQQVVASTVGIDFVRSSSSNSVSIVEVHMKLGEDADVALTEVSTKVSSIRGELPIEAEDPVIAKQSAEGFALAYYGFYSETLSDVEVTDYLLRTIQPALATVKGVAEAEILGGKTYSMRVWMDPVRMAAQQVSAADIVNAIGSENYQSAAGQTRGQLVQTDVNAVTDSSDPDVFKRFIIREEGENKVRLGDVADIELGAENYDSLVMFDNVPSIYIGINGTTDGNPLTTIKLVTAELEKMKSSFPPGLQVAIAYDSTEFIQASINEVILTLAQASIIVVIIIFLFLGSFRSTLIPLVTIPLSIIGVLFYMQIMGYSINLLTLLAMVMAIGLLVDDAILVVENIYRHIGEGLRPFQAALQGAREIAKPVIATTIVLCVVYAPIGLLGGLTGVLFKEFAFTLVGTIIISTIIALTLSPMMCSRVLKPTIANNAYARFVNDLFERIHLAYEEALASSLKTRSVTVVFTFCILLVLMAMTLPGILIGPQFQFIQNELAPEEDQGVIFTFSQAPDHTSLDYLNKYTAPYIDIFREYQDEYQSSFMANGFGGPTVSFAGMLLKPWEERSMTSMEMIPRIQVALDQQPGLQSFAFNPASLPGSSGNTPVEFILKTQQGYDQLFGVVQQVLAKARESGKFFFIKSDFNFSKPEIRVIIDRERAESMGISMREIGQTLGAILAEGYVSRFNLAGRSYKIIPQARRQERQNADIVSQYYVYSDSGEQINLSTMVEIDYTAVPRELVQFQQQNAAKIDAVPAVPLGEALQVLRDITTQVAPAGYTFDYQGQSRQLIQEGSVLALTFGFAIIVVFLVLAAQYESLRDPLIILTTVPLAMFGAMIPMFLSMVSMNIYSQVGLITLIGLVSKHGILIVEFANEMQKNDNLSPTQAVIKAASLRLRPILMTSFSTIIGIMPLVIASGAGAASRQSIGITIVTGFAIGTLFTLFVLPVIYTFFAADHRPAIADETLLPSQLV